MLIDLKLKLMDFLSSHDVTGLSLLSACTADYNNRNNIGDEGAEIIKNMIYDFIHPSLADGLRADCVAYYKVDETSGTRIDSSPNHFDMPEIADSPPTPATSAVGSIAGKIGNAVQIFDNPTSVQCLGSDAISIPVINKLTTVCWVKFNSLTGGNAIPSNNQSFDALNLFTPGFIDVLRCVVAFADVNNKLYLCSYLASTPTPGSELSPNTWYFCEAIFTLTNTTVAVDLYVNNSLYWSLAPQASTQLQSTPYTIAVAGSPNYLNTSDWIAVDETAIWTRQLSTAERDYLYNSGNGRTLYD